MTEPTADDINRLEKAAWDANVDQVLVWERVQSERMERQFTALRRALAALEAEMHERTLPSHIESDTEYWADRIAAILAQYPES